jgi:putative thioredoxin
MTTISPYITDVTEQDFAQKVLAQSQTVPVVVDFWAAWCGPCRMLGPILERLAIEFKGAFILAKLDVDSNQRLSAQYKVQGIPAVKAFMQGKVVGEFTGALPEPRVREFLQGLVPSTADKYAQQAFQWENDQQLAMAESLYRQALQEKSDHYPSMVGLGRVLIRQGKIEDGVTLLKTIPAGLPEGAAAQAIMATAQFMQEATGQHEADLWAKLVADPKDVISRYTLASLLATEQRYLEALEEFLTIVRQNKQDKARQAMLALFAIMGEEDETTRTYRRKLANALF